MPTPIIAFVGAAQAGKTTAATALVEQGWTLFSFASPLRAMLAGLLGEGHPALARDADKEAPLPELGGRSIRYALQTLGTGWGREMMDRDLWVTRGIDHIFSTTPEVGWVMDDVRFPNEFQALAAIPEFYAIRLRRPVVEPDDRSGVHASELGWATFPADEEWWPGDPNTAVEEIQDRAIRLGLSRLRLAK